MKSHAVLGHFKVFLTTNAIVNVATCATCTCCVVLFANYRRIRNKENYLVACATCTCYIAFLRYNWRFFIVKILKPFIE